MPETVSTAASAPRIPISVHETTDRTIVKVVDEDTEKLVTI